MTRYQRADAETVALVYEVMERKHGGLRDAGVTVDVLMAYAKTDKNGDTVGTAIKVRGQSVMARIYANSHKLRALGLADLVIEIDGDRWDTLTNHQRRSRINHEFRHKELKLRVDKETESEVVARHKDDERPLFTTRYHDVEVGWFLEVGDSDGMDSAEVEQFHEITRRCQTWLPFTDYSLDEEQGEIRDKKPERAGRH